jgi:predicted AAA+ superfamily ATPase
MTFDPESITSGHTLIQRLDEYNPWWSTGKNELSSDGFSSLRQVFHQLYSSIHDDEQRLLALAGPDSSGKSLLLNQLISAHIDPDFVEKFFRIESQREAAHENLVPASNVMYVPLRDDPLFQLRPEEQLRSAVDHFETHVLRKHKSDTHYLFFDDLHLVERPNKRGNIDVGRWEQLLAELLANHDGRHIVFSGLSSAHSRERLETIEVRKRGDSPPEPVNIYPLGFADFLRMRYRDIALAPGEERFDETTIRESLRRNVDTEAASHLVSTIQEQEAASVIDPSTTRREIANYCTTGGIISLQIASRGVRLDGEQFSDVIRRRGDSVLESVQQQSLDHLRNGLLRAAANLGGIKDASGLERLCALASHTRPTDDVLFDDLTAALDVDRRTLRDKYLGTLSQLHLLSAAPEYDNQRPRKIRLYMRDPGITNAFCRNDLNDVLRRQPGLDEELAKAVAFDHTVRLSNELNHRLDPKRGVVKFWSGTKGSVDFVLKIGGKPVPILWSYNRSVDELRRSIDTPDFDALCDLLTGDAHKTERDRIDELQFNDVGDDFAAKRREYVQREEYSGQLGNDETAVFDGEPPFGMVLTNSRNAVEEGVSVVEVESKPVIQLPLWTYLRLSS